MDAKSKWPEAVGKDGEEAKLLITSECPDVQV
jgi:hypothetical protein